MDNTENRKALLKSLIGAIGSNRIKGFSVKKVDLYDTSDMKNKTEPGDDELAEEDTPMTDMLSFSKENKADGETTGKDEYGHNDDEMESPEEIKALLEEARAARRSRK